MFSGASGAKKRATILGRSDPAGSASFASMKKLLFVLSLLFAATVAAYGQPLCKTYSVVAAELCQPVGWNPVNVNRKNTLKITATATLSDKSFEMRKTQRSSRSMKIR